MPAAQITPWLIPLAVALATTVLVSPVVGRVLAKYGRTDLPFCERPGDRPAIRGGGMALFISCAVAVLLIPRDQQNELGRVLGVAVALGLLGIADDIREIGHGPKFAYQVLVLAAGSAWLAWLDPSRLWLWPVAFVVMILASNAINFMDGINGVTVLLAVVVGVDYAILGTIYHTDSLRMGALITVAIALGFLPFNFPRARLFMGDAGTYFLGAWGSALTVIGLLHHVPLVALMLPALPYAADTASTLFRRMARGAAWTHSHREHVYHQLVVLGWTHTATATTIAALSAFCAAVGVLAAGQPPAVQVGAVVLCLLPNALYVCLPSLIRRREVVAAPVASTSSSEPR